MTHKVKSGAESDDTKDDDKIKEFNGEEYIIQEYKSDYCEIIYFDKPFIPRYFEASKNYN
jgi:hypothetical protein